MNEGISNRIRSAPSQAWTVRPECAGHDDRVASRARPPAARRATLWIAAAAVLCWLTPYWSDALEFQRSASGQLWRLVTGHLVHFSFEHFALDTAVLVCLGLACEHRDVWRTRWTFVLAPLAVSIGVLLCAPGIEHYRGLSGIDSALFALFAALVWRRRAHHSQRTLLLALVPAALFLGKVTYEVVQGGALFLPGESVPSPVPVAHLAGALCGLFVGLVPNRRAGPQATPDGC